MLPSVIENQPCFWTDGVVCSCVGIKDHANAFIVFYLYCTLLSFCVMWSNTYAVEVILYYIVVVRVGCSLSFVVSLFFDHQGVISVFVFFHLVVAFDVSLLYSITEGNSQPTTQYHKIVIVSSQNPLVAIMQSFIM